MNLGVYFVVKRPKQGETRGFSNGLKVGLYSYLGVGCHQFMAKQREIHCEVHV